MSGDRTPQEIAEMAARAMWASDHASQGLGIEIVSVGPGVAILSMIVGETTVAAHCAITFIKPGRRGDRLVAAAREISRSGRSGIYDVSVGREGEILAEFRGHSRTVGGSFIEGKAP